MLGRPEHSGLCDDDVAPQGETLSTPVPPAGEILFSFRSAKRLGGRPKAAPTEHPSQIPDRANHFVPPDNPAKSYKNRQY